MNAATKPNNNKSALAAVKARYVRVPSTAYPKFCDLITGIQNTDKGYLLHAFRSNGGSGMSEDDLFNHLEFINGDGFIPNAPARLSGNLINLWKPPLIQPSGNVPSALKVAPFLEFLERWFPIEAERDYFTWWLAHSVRRPEKRITATVLLRSEHGVGKGFLTETLLANLIGKSSVAQCALKDIVGNFNEMMEGKTLIMIDEVYKTRKATTDALKTPQGSKTLVLNRKHKPAITVDNYINFIMTSNDHLPVVLEEGDRRFWIPQYIRHCKDPSETGNFINHLLKPWLEDKGFQLVRDWLETVDLKKYWPTAHPPMTASKSDFYGWTAADKLKEFMATALAGHQVITLDWLHSAIRSSNFACERYGDNSLADALLSFGCVQKRTNTVRYWITPEGIAAGLSTGTAPKALAELMSDYSQF